MPVEIMMKMSSADEESRTPSYRATLRRADAAQWDDARANEMDGFVRMNVVRHVPEDTCPGWDAKRRRATSVTDTLWANLTKLDADGNVCGHRARCVFNGAQRSARSKASGNLIESFAPSVRHSTFKTACAVACARKQGTCQFDVPKAYLQGEFNEGQLA